jgi:predicted small lipoprotein YifL
MVEPAKLRVVLAALLLGTLAACGFRGDLYLPGQVRDIVTRPTQTPVPPETGEAPNSPRTPDSPVEPASPAPEVTAPPAGQETAEEDKPARDEEVQGAPPPR